MKTTPNLPNKRGLSSAMGNPLRFKNIAKKFRGKWVNIWQPFQQWGIQVRAQKERTQGKENQSGGKENDLKSQGFQACWSGNEPLSLQKKLKKRCGN